MIELFAANSELQKTLVLDCTHKTELEAEAASLQADLLVAVPKRPFSNPHLMRKRE